MSSITPKKREQLKAVYMHVYGAFASDVSEVAAATGVSVSVARNLLKQLQAANLVDSHDVNDSAQGQSRRGQFKEVTWQANETYDSATREQAEATFDAAYPVAAPAEVAAPAPAEESKPKRAAAKASGKLTTREAIVKVMTGQKAMRLNDVFEAAHPLTNLGGATPKQVFYSIMYGEAKRADGLVTKSTSKDGKTVFTLNPKYRGDRVRAPKAPAAPKTSTAKRSAAKSSSAKTSTKRASAKRSTAKASTSKSRSSRGPKALSDLLSFDK